MITARSLIILGALAMATPTALLAQQVELEAILAGERAVTDRVDLVAPTPAEENGETRTISRPVVQPLPGELRELQDELPEHPHWTSIDARALILLVRGIGAEGLDPDDYDPEALGLAVEAGEGPELDRVASETFAQLVEDLRDGRTPLDARYQWFADDHDAAFRPTDQIMAEALFDHNIAGVVDQLAPSSPDYALLKQALAETPDSEPEKIALIRANMDRWRWLSRDLGDRYLIVNVPEFQLRFRVRDEVINTYRVIVGTPGRNATPQFSEEVEGVILNPTWTVPQSIVKGEGLGARVLNNPAWAKARGYKATRGANGYVSVVQQPGPQNALGQAKLDMPNPHSIFLHDTAAKQLFDTEVRAYSHGCIRTENAPALAIALAIIHAGITAEEGAEHLNSRQYTRIPFDQTIPVYITYFTMGPDVDGALTGFADIYDRDAPVLASFRQSRASSRQRHSLEEIEGSLPEG